MKFIKVDLISFDQGGLIQDFKVMLRPPKTAILVGEKMKKRMEQVLGAAAKL